MSISIGEIAVVLLVAILFIKPENLPETAHTLGKWLQWLRQTTNSVRREIEKPLGQAAEGPPSAIPQPLRATLPQLSPSIDKKPHD